MTQKLGLLLSLLFVALARPDRIARLAPGQSGEQRPPNLIVVMTDEHNFRTLGCYRRLLAVEQAQMWGPVVVETPNIDSLARDGAICTSFYATSPLCTPSRGVFCTGLYPYTTGVVANQDPLPDDAETFATWLGERGYATGFIGKWHLDGVGKPQWAPERRFGFEDNRYMFNRGHWKRLELTESGPRVASRDSRGRPAYALEEADAESFTTDFLTSRAIEFIGEHEDGPFCLMLSIPDPHGPDTVRAPYDEMFAGESFRQPSSHDADVEGWPAWAQPKKGGQSQAKYFGMVRCIDDNVGRLLDDLRERDLLDNTWVVFTSDHGDLRGEHHRQNKNVPFEASARVPFIIRGPGIEPGRVIDSALALVDFFPTLCDVYSASMPAVAAPPDLEGTSFAPLLAGEEGDPGARIAFLRQGGSTPGWIAAVNDRYKLILTPGAAPVFLDLELDPDELVNRYVDQRGSDDLRSLAAALHSHGARFGDPILQEPDVREVLDEARGD